MLDYYREPYGLSSQPITFEPPRVDPPVLRFEGADMPTEDSGQPRMPHVRCGQMDRSEGQLEVGKSTPVEHNDPGTHHNEASLDDQLGKDGIVSAAQAKSSRYGLVYHLLDTPNVKQKQPMEGLQTILDDEQSSHEQIYEAYCQLPSPGVKYLSAHYRLLLSQRLSAIERKNKKAMLRYFHLIDDMKEASIPLNEAEWNSAIAYVGRCFGDVEASDVKNALSIWKEMDQEACVRSSTVTFNILFDVATRAGKFVLAEMVLREMQARGLEYDRFSYVGFIFYYGMKGDGAGVRRAYRELVEAGHIVDTRALNCVIASLIRAGELPAAEQVYERMKRLLYEKTAQPVPVSDWKSSRDLGRALNRAGRAARGNEQLLHRLQAEQYLAPNLHTFYTFIDHHVRTTGELRHVMAWLGEMQSLQIPMHGSVFVKIFQGFGRHGGVKYTSWTRQRLETVWESLLVALDQELEDVQMMKWMVVWVIRAFAKCCGQERTLQIWEQVRDRWKISGEDEKDTVEYLVSDTLKAFYEEDILR
ncbi:MAG: hypothetical protein Q9196_004948 [Gyalolechia fulgens]